MENRKAQNTHNDYLGLSSEQKDTTKKQPDYIIKNPIKPSFHYVI